MISVFRSISTFHLMLNELCTEFHVGVSVGDRMLKAPTSEGAVPLAVSRGLMCCCNAPAGVPSAAGPGAGAGAEPERHNAVVRPVLVCAHSMPRLYESSDILSLLMFHGRKLPCMVLRNASRPFHVTLPAAQLLPECSAAGRPCQFLSWLALWSDSGLQGLDDCCSP